MENFIKQDIKTDPITKDQLDEMKNLAGTYEALFSRRAILYKEMKLREKVLTEEDYKRLILKEYTFLKRPVMIAEDKIFVGNDQKTLVAAQKMILKG